MKNNNKQTNKKRSLFHWHRQIGLAVSLFVIILSVTGILLNHTEDLELDSNHVQSELLLQWYGIKKPVITSYSVGKNWISHVSDKIYFNAQLIEEVESISGAVIIENFIAVATTKEIILLTHDGQKIETLDSTTGVPNKIKAIGMNSKSQLFIKTNAAVFQANSDITDWINSKEKNIVWAKTSPLPRTLNDSLNTLFRGKGLSKERVILDIHSGRIFGKAGTLIMDLSALLLLVLTFTGAWMYAKRSWAMRKRNLLLAAAARGDTYSAADLRRGEEGIILTVIGEEAFRQRLASMGVMAGTVIATPDTSIFGDPRTYIVRGYQLSMRTTEAAMILLQTDELLEQHSNDPAE